MVEGMEYRDSLAMDILYDGIEVWRRHVGGGAALYVVRHHEIMTWVWYAGIELIVGDVAALAFNRTCEMHFDASAACQIDAYCWARGAAGKLCNCDWLRWSRDDALPRCVDAA